VRPPAPPRRLVVLSTVLLVVVMLGLMEGVTRWLAPQTTYTEVRERFLINRKVDFDIPFYETSAIFPFTLTPNFKGEIVDRRVGGEFTVVLNGAGFRTHALAPRAPGEVRIVVIGDSTTFGTGVEANVAYPQTLERLLKGASSGGHVFKVFNLGVGNYGPVEYYLVAKTYLPRLKPDLVIVAFFAGNDLNDLINSDVTLDDRGLPERVRRRGVSIDDRHRLRSESSRSVAYSWPIVRNSHLGILLTESTVRIAAFLGRGMKRTAPPAPQVPLERLVKGIDALSSEVAAKLVWVILPSRDDVKAERPGPFLDAVATLPSATVVDGIADLRNAGGDFRRYYVDDVHFGPEGTLLIARVLEPVVLRLVSSP
jgi:lysophospholipase L1-like esterase